MTSALQQTWRGLRAILVLTVILGVLYPLAVTGVAQLVFPWQANGSLVLVDGKPVASAQLGQAFTDDRWLWGRPSAAGDGYDGAASGGSNQGPNSADLVAAIEERRAELAKANGVAPEQIPADALTASASGLDPDISPAYAAIQVDRIATARGVSADQVRAAIASATHGRILGFLGEPRVNVVEANLALAEIPAR